MLSLAMNSYSTWSTCSAMTSYCSCEMELDSSSFRRQGRTKFGGSLLSFAPIMSAGAVLSAPPPRMRMFPGISNISQQYQLHTYSPHIHHPPALPAACSAGSKPPRMHK